MTCPCGCGGAVKRGNRYATAACFSRLSRASARPYKTSAQIRLQAVIHEPQTSWWTDSQAQRDRAAFHAAMAPRLAHLGMTKFGRLHGAGITAGDDPSLSDRRRVVVPAGEGL